jgi:hypothetical protein
MGHSHRTRPYHGKNESTIVFGANPILCCISGQRLASGEPVICTKDEYRAIATSAATAGLGGKRSFWEAHCVGIPCFGHSLDLRTITAALGQEFPTKIIQVEDSYEGCDNCGHWEFIVRIRPRGGFGGGGGGAGDAEEAAPPPAVGVRAMVMMKG